MSGIIGDIEEYSNEPPPQIQENIQEENRNDNTQEARRFSMDLEHNDKKSRANVVSSRKEEVQVTLHKEKVFLLDCCLRPYNSSQIDMRDTLCVDLVVYLEYIQELQRNTLNMPQQIKQQLELIVTIIQGLLQYTVYIEGVVSAVQCYFSDDHNTDGPNIVECLSKKCKKMKVKFGYQGHLLHEMKKRHPEKPHTLREVQGFIMEQRIQAMLLCNRFCCDINTLLYNMVLYNRIKTTCKCNAKSNNPKKSNNSCIDHHVDRIILSSVIYGSISLILSSMCIHSTEYTLPSSINRGQATSCIFTHLVNSSFLHISVLLSYISISSNNSGILSNSNMLYNIGEIVLIHIHDAMSPLYCIILSSYIIHEKLYYTVLPLQFQAYTTVKYGQSGVYVGITHKTPFSVSNTMIMKDPEQLDISPDAQHIYIPSLSTFIEEYITKCVEQQLQDVKLATVQSINIQNTENTELYENACNMSNNSHTNIYSQEYTLHTEEYISEDYIYQDNEFLINWDILEDWSNVEDPPSIHVDIDKNMNRSQNTNLQILNAPLSSQELQFLQTLLTLGLLLHGCQQIECNTGDIPYVAQLQFTQQYYTNNYNTTFTSTYMNASSNTDHTRATVGLLLQALQTRQCESSLYIMLLSRFQASLHAKNNSTNLTRLLPYIDYFSTSFTWPTS